MASSSKKKTTFAKITRENTVRERRMLKQQRKDARKQAAADGTLVVAETEDPAVTEARLQRMPDLD